MERPRDDWLIGLSRRANQRPRGYSSESEHGFGPEAEEMDSTPGSLGALAVSTWCEWEPGVGLPWLASSFRCVCHGTGHDDVANG